MMELDVPKFIADKVASILSLDQAVVNVDFPELKFGDYSTNAAMITAKKMGKPPMDIAQNLAVEISKDEQASKIFAKIEPVNPGFLNFYLSPEYLSANINSINRKPEVFGSSQVGGGRLVLIEYFQLNAAKPPHVAHLRSAVIGDSLKRIFISQGYKTVSDTHIGDWGTQFGILIWAYKNLEGRKKVKANPLEDLNNLYIEANKLMEERPEIRSQAKQEFVELEAGNKENRKLWEFFVSVTTKQIKNSVKELKLLAFDHHLGESFYVDKMKEILEKLRTHNFLIEGETGEKYVDLSSWGLGRLICIKNDGATTYELRDLATLAYRYEELSKKNGLPLEYNLYVVDNRQAHDLRQVFKTMELLGYDTKKSVHVDFGFMSLPEGTISTRKGNVIYLDKLLEEAYRRASEIITEKNPGLKNKEEIAKSIGLAAIKYANLSPNRHSDIVFRWEQVLNFEGNTGPYLQYTHARLRSILRKADRKTTKIEASSGNEKEMALARKLVHFPQIIQKSATELMPSILALYLYDLAGMVNNFYHEVPVLKADEQVKEGRLALVAASAEALRNGLYLLGIEAPDQM